MLTLGIDTSAVTASVGLVKDGEAVCEFSLTGGLTHSEHLIPMIENSLHYSGFSPKDIDVYAVSVGPGSFTGLRIGVSTVKGMAFFENKPCVPVSTLDALAQRLKGFEATLCPVMDARRGEFYNALFSSDITRFQRLCDDRAVSAKTLEEELKSHARVIVNGDGAKKLLSLISLPNLICAPPNLLRQSGAQVALIGETKFQNKQAVSASDLSPRYLRLPQAERELLKKTTSKGEQK